MSGAGAGRKSINLRLPVDLHDEFAAAAAERDLPFNWLAVRALREFLERLVPADEWRLTRDDSRAPSTDLPTDGG